MWKFSIDMAERNGADLRRRLDSAERFSDRAIARGLFLVKTPGSRSSASLVCMTRRDQREPFFAGLRLPFAPWLRPERVPRRDFAVAMTASIHPGAKSSMRAMRAARETG